MESASKGRRSFSLVSFLVWVEVFHILQPLIEISILLEILSNPLEAFLSLIGCNEEPNRATTMESKDVKNFYSDQEWNQKKGSSGNFWWYLDSI